LDPVELILSFLTRDDDSSHLDHYGAFMADKDRLLR
jgi:hypothetical protein